MPALWGLGLAAAAALLARLAGLDRDRAFYPLVLIVIASYYELFAVMAGDEPGLAETLAFALFAGAAVIGFRFSLWIVVAALAAHGLFDFFHHALLAGRGVPSWWPSFCMAYDLAAATLLAVILRHRRLSGGALTRGVAVR